ncbi:MAG TPA: hypothetical protein VNI77_11010 [Nitrososphaera sp.]|nr:hypothetical protein [Nitrososphaera sp.]
MPLCIWYRTELKKKNLMERFILQVKDRTECFDDYFPCRKKGRLQQAAYMGLAEALLAILAHGNRQEKVHVTLARGGG